MTIPVTRTHVLSLAPNAKPQYLAAFDGADEILSRYGANENALRVAHFMAQVLHETGGLTILRESLNYASADRLMAVWPKRFPTRDAAAPYVHNPEKLANFVYARKELGNVNAGDGWRFIGRGMIQITGRDAYERFGRELGVDLAADPELAVDPRFSLAIAAVEWKASGCNALADADDVKAVTRAINGGYIGLDERRGWLVKTKRVWR